MVDDMKGSREADKPLRAQLEGIIPTMASICLRVDIDPALASIVVRRVEMVFRSM